ncbi:MAG: CotH kinase family protein, partial [Prevotellaceae bacterium]|nr:CotH kinase family protein [Prevotellaceae bacterium]
IDVDVKILWNENGNNNSIVAMANNASVYYDRKAVMNYRGSTSRSMIKRSYAFSTGKKDLKSNGSVEKGKVDLFGLPEEKDWVLYAAYNDKSMMRNKLALDLYRQMGYYASNTRFVELFVNDVYQGVYILLEKYEENENRIVITEETTGMQPQDIGYIIKFDKTDGSAATWVRTPALLGGMANCGNDGGCGIASDAQGWELVYPEVSSNNDPRKNYIRDWLVQYEIALKNATAQQDWDNLFETYIDIPSFVDFMIINEFSRNTDGYRASMWFVKDAGSKLKCTPIWDFEMGFGNDDKYPSFYGSANRTCPSTTNIRPYATDIWQYNTNECEPYYPLPFWYKKLMENQCFKDIFRTRWEELRTNALSTTNIENELETNKTALLSGALNREMDKWSWTVRNACPCESSYAYCPWMITHWEANYQGVGNPEGKTTNFNDEYNLLKAWINSRLVWMDSQIMSDDFGAILTEEQARECGKIPEIISGNQVIQAENNYISINANNTNIEIKSNETIQEVLIYDTRGILLLQKNKINAAECSFNLNYLNQLLIVKVLTENSVLSKIVLVKE